MKTPLLALGALTAAALAVGAYTLVDRLSASPAKAASRTERQPQATPTADEFAIYVTTAANRYAAARRSGRIENTTCVQAAPGKYMCAYTARRAGAAECHLMQAEWTPGEASNFTVTLAGRTARCGTVREAVRSLE